MKDQNFGRRDFLKGAVAGSVAAANLPQSAQAQQAPAAPATAGYSFLNLDEAAFVEALVDHMVPADELSPKGLDIPPILLARADEGDRMIRWREFTSVMSNNVPCGALGPSLGSKPNGVFL